MPNIDSYFDNNMKLVYDVHDLSRMGFGTEDMVRYRIREGELPAFREGARYLVLHDDLVAYIEMLKAETRKAAAMKREAKRAVM